MIFVTVGTQAPFDRLVQYMDEIYVRLDTEELVVQAPLAKYKPINFQVLDFLDPQEFDRLINRADLIISHAGMGTIITALTIGKPIIIVPRLACSGEHRNDHQLATVARMIEFPNVRKAVDRNELLQECLIMKKLLIPFDSKIGKFASLKLINSLRDFIQE